MDYKLTYFIQSTILILLSPLFLGFLKKVKAYLRGFVGPSIFQVYFDIYKLFNKSRVISKSSLFITEIGPTFCLAASIAAAYLIPVVYTYASENNYIGSIFITLFLFAIIKFFYTLIGLDCASTFGGMGSSRELFISMMAEPVLFTIITYLFSETGTFNVFSIAYLNSNVSSYNITHITASVALIILILAENTRMPVDNPETHLELTMVHEAMILDMSGRDLAYLELTSMIKLTVYLTIFINCFIPYGIAASIGLAAIIKAIMLYLVKMSACLIGIAILETSIAKFRLFRVPELLAAAFSISIISIAIRYFF